MIQLRPYQQESIAALRDTYRNHTRIILCIPTGGGKTVIFSQICASAIERGKRVLILSDRTEIFKQTVAAMTRHNIPVCKIDPDTKRIAPNAELFIGMVETFKRRMSAYQHIRFDLIICDEAHKAAFFKVYDAYPNTHTLGCTASPIHKKLHAYYTKIVAPVTVSQLIEQKYLSPCKGYQMVDNFDDLQKDKSGEFTEKSQFDHFARTKLYDGLIEQYVEKCRDRKTVIFCVNIAHVEETVKMLRVVGVKAYGISSNTPEREREWILSEFARSRDIVLVNANILIAGWDVPDVDAIVVYRATSSLISWLQMAGRGSRIFPGKQNFLLIDFGGNFSRLGLWDEDREWSLEPPKKKRATLGAAPVKSCKACSAMLPALCRECPYCGYLYQPTEKELAQGIMVEVTNRIRAGIEGRYVSQLTVPELIELEKTKVMKPAYVWRVVRSMGATALYQYAEMKGHRPEWTVRQLEAMEAEGKTQFADKKINEVPLL